MDNNSGKNKIIALAVAVTLLLSVFCSPAFASLQNELDNVNNKKNNAQQQLNEGKKKATELGNQIKSLENQIYKAEVNLNNIERNINTTKASIQQALAELTQLESDIGQQNDDLNLRLRTMYKNGEVGMLSVLFGSSSMSDFMVNMDMVERIYDSDAKLLAEIQGQYDEVDKKRNELQALKDSLLAQQKELEEKQASLESDKKEVESLKTEVDKDNAVLAKQVDDLKKEADALSAEILRLQSGGAYAGGTMCWPAQSSTRITSPYGNRIHPILKVQKFHTGIDIGASKGTNILAANSGTVITAGWNNSYGYMVMVDHGGGIVTLYAHSSKLLVSKGDKVKRGQAIALVGSTGNSTGPHLHFEVRVNGKYQNPLNYVSTSVRN